MKENNHQLCVREHKNICGNFSYDFVWSQLPLWNKSLFTAVKLLKLFHLFTSRPFFSNPGNDKHSNNLKVKSQTSKRWIEVDWSKVAVTFDSINSFQVAELNKNLVDVYQNMNTSSVCLLLNEKPDCNERCAWIDATVFRFGNIFKLHFRFSRKMRQAFLQVSKYVEK